MENKRLIWVMLLSFLIITIWMWGKVFVESRWPTPKPVANTQPATLPDNMEGPEAPDTRPTTRTAAGPTTATAGAIAIGAAAKEDKILGLLSLDPDKNDPITLGMMLNARGASLDAVMLRRERAELKKNDPYVYQKPYDSPDPYRNRALATQGITVNGTFVDLANVIWKLVESTDLSAKYEATVKIGGADAVRVTKTYLLHKSNAPDGGYEVEYTHDLRNLSSAPVEVKVFFNGPNVPPSENSRDIPEVVSGHLAGTIIEVEHKPVTSFKVEQGAQPIDAKAGPIHWVGFTSAYFNGLVRAADPKAPINIAAIRTQALKDVGDTYNASLNLTFESTPISLAPDGSASLPMVVHFGPKSRALLNTAHYADAKLAYDKTLVLTGGLCGICTFQWLINVLVAMLGWFHAVIRDWGIAIIVLVVIVRLLLHPITKKSQINMAKMGKMGPEIEKLKKKHGDNKEELNKAMMTFYKEQGATPILGCLPMFLQMPIWIALWSSLQSTFELRHAPFLYGWTWIDDLSQPDRLIAFGRHVLQFWKFPGIDALNLLPILLGVLFFVQQKLTPKPPAMTPEQEQQQKIMQWMTLLFPLLLYNGPAGLNLYIFASTLIGIIESKRIRDHLKQVEEAEKSGRVIVDAGGRGSKRGGGGSAAAAAQPPKPQGFLGRLMTNLQAKAEEMRNEADKKNKKRP